MSVTTNGSDCNGGLVFFSVNVSYQYYIPNLKIVSFDIFCRIYFVLSVFFGEKKINFSYFIVYLLFTDGLPWKKRSLSLHEITLLKVVHS